MGVVDGDDSNSSLKFVVVGVDKYSTTYPDIFS